MRVCWHLTSGGECGEHLIHRVAVCDGPARDSWTNFNRRILSFHGQNPTTAVRIARIFWSDRRGDLDSAPRRNELNSSTEYGLFSWFPGFLICLTLMTCHPPVIAGNMPP